MKVTVCFGRTGIVVPCKEGQLCVRELTQQALQRYLKTREKDPGYWVKIHHLEYTDGGILDPDDVLADVVEDKDKLIAVFDEQEPLHKIESPSGNPAGRQSPEAFETEVAAQLAAFKPIGGEIEVTPSALKLGTPLLVRRSSDPVPGPPADTQPSASHPGGQSLKPVILDSTQNLEEGEVMNGVQTEALTSLRAKDALSDMTRTVEISGEGGPLGIHVVPFFSSLSGRILGLFIRGIEENSRSKREGLFHENECIVKINNVDLVDKTFAHAQDVFRQAMKAPSVLLHVLPPQNREQYEKSVIGPLNIFGNNDSVLRTKPPPSVHGKSGMKMVNLTGTSSPEEDASTSLQQSKSPRVPRLGRKPSSPSLSPLMGFGSKKNAKKIKIDLKKGPEGLGFTVVTRDSSIHGPGPIFVKNILPKGAAIKDGRLQSGDRILEVNGRDVTGRTQEELVAMLRSTKQGETASLVIARQEGTFLPRELQKGEPDCYAVSLETTEQLTFEIPLNDSGSAGLGVSLKGNKSRETGTDLGIFIKSIIHGGAAFKDGRLRMNDQLIAVNGESLLGKSNHEAMETLRRSMSMEGNIRGMIQLVILRRPERPMEEPAEYGAFSKPCFENCHNAVTTSRRNDNSTLHPFGTYSPQEKQREPLLPSDGWAESEVPPSPPPHPILELGLEDYSHSSGVDSAVYFPDQHINFRSVTPARQPESMNLKASKSMDLVPDESKVHSLAGHKSESPGKGFGPTLGLKKSSSLESLQTAVAEVRKNELPFHRPRPHMVRGRGCNESFRAAIDKSYDGPEELEADGLSDKSSHSGQGALNCESAPQGNSELEDIENKARKVKKTKEKEKKKEKGKLKVKEKKQKEENEDPERKIKRKGFGAMLRFGKKKDDKGGKAEQKGPLKHGGLREEELEKMKEERERIGAKHQELREKQARALVDYATSTIGSLHDMDDDEMDPNYARVNHFREPCASTNVYRSPSPPRAGPLAYPRDGRPLSPERDNLESLYAKVNKPYHPPVPVDSGRPMSGSADRIQRLRKEYYQARREGFALYEDDEGRARPSDYDLHWVSGKGPDGNTHNLRFEGMERQYASLPRGGPADPVDYLTAAHRGLYKERELPYYPGAHPMHLTKGSYPRPPDLRVADLRYPQYYPPPPAPQHKGPFRQDVPPSPPQHHRVPAYQEMGRAGPRGGSPDQYPYRTQDPRQKNPMTAAV
ncbi:partitioning defective 3 homolog B isoform X1 [Rousettus aegyptiacus]|uniref:Partitioning defective 3 homolog B n=1 Tax=Rousettus aegyptiacus TaxID=9407 RepID=A0A7J8JKQ8_ROUAE|nr:partitioning defective 3 homolog B isoform X1 [Rousettus aegyptiacus]KAF6496895.1 par-3 family cell polarity regulator beta [Rousettus aegyptiacus]